MAGLQYISHKQAIVNEANEKMFEVDRRLYVDADKSKIVEESSPEAAYLLAPGAGHRIPLAQAIELGLATAEQAEDKPEAKAAEKPAEKAAPKAADKGRK